MASAVDDVFFCAALIVVLGLGATQASIIMVKGGPVECPEIVGELARLETAVDGALVHLLHEGPALLLVDDAIAFFSVDLIPGVINLLLEGFSCGGATFFLVGNAHRCLERFLSLFLFFSERLHPFPDIVLQGLEEDPLAGQLFLSQGNLLVPGKLLLFCGSGAISSRSSFVTCFNHIEVLLLGI